MASSGDRSSRGRNSNSSGGRSGGAKRGGAGASKGGGKAGSRPGARKPAGAGGRSGPGGPKRSSGPGSQRKGAKPSGSKPRQRSAPGGTAGRTSGGAPRKYSSAKGRRDETDEAIPGNPAWGGLARKGALRATHDEIREYEERDTPYRHDPEEQAKYEQRQARRAAQQARSDALREEARTAVARANEAAPPKKKRKPRAKPARDRAPLGHGKARNEDEVAALNRLLGPAEAKKQLRKLKTAGQSYEAERYADALKSLKAIVALAPSVPELRELHGLILYRMGRYKAAADELEAFRELADSTEQNPVLADCYRAQQRWADVAELWEELAGASPGADVVNEGRIVMAGAMADQGDLRGAVRLLEKGWKRPTKPREHHLRRAYALADLYERSGDLPRARSMFDWVVKYDSDFVDARRRLRSLR